MPATKAVRVSIYINEADEWHGKPLHLEVLRYLAKEGCAGGTVLRGLAGFTGARGVVTTSLVDAGGKLPLVIEYIDTPEAVERVLPTLRKMASHRLITREELEVVTD
jgi:PII-like signaling protein